MLLNASHQQCRIIAAQLRSYSESPRSGRQHKAWDVSPRIALAKAIKARAAGGSRIISTNVKRNGYHPLRGFN